MGIETTCRVAALAAGMALAGTASAWAQGAGVPARAEQDEFTIVECVLPGRMVQQGMRRTYMTGGRVIRATAKDCAVSGGSFVIEQEGHLKHAYDIWIKPAESGDKQAQYYLGEILERGVNGRPDYAGAAQWYRRAAEQDDRRAATALARLYDEGLGVPKDPAEASRWVQRASGLSDAVLKTFAEKAAADRIGRLEQDLASRQQEIDQLRQQVERLRGELEGTRRQLSAETRRADATRADIAKLSEDRDRRKNEVAQLANDAKARQEAQRQLDAANAQLARKQQDLAKRENQIKELNAAVARLQEEIKTKQPVVQAAATAPTSTAPRGDAQAAAPKRAIFMGDPSKFGRYHALLIGVDKYTHWDPLKNGVSDAHGIGEVLKSQYGFTVEIMDNPRTRADIMRKLNDYRQKLTNEDNFLLFYAGHGYLEEQTNEGYWIPTAAERNNTAEWLETNVVAGQLKMFNARQILVIADSCYGGIMTRNMVAELRGGLTPEQRFENLGRLANNRPRVVLSSGGLQPVMDAGGGTNSAFSGILIDVLKGNDDLIEAVKLYDSVRLRVSELASRYKFEQIPTYGPMVRSEHSAGDFIFVPRR